jgi:hypothetical protein
LIITDPFPAHAQRQQADSQIPGMPEQRPGYIALHNKVKGDGCNAKIFVKTIG